MKTKYLWLLAPAAVIFLASNSAQATPAYRACLHEQAELYAIGNNLLGNGRSLGSAIVAASNYCIGQMRLMSN